MGFRLTAFPGMGAKVSVDDWFEKLTGQAPEQITRQRSGEVTAVGIIEGARLVLNIDLVRIEWRLIPPEDVSILTSDFPHIGNFVEIGNRFSDLMSEWLRIARLQD